MDEVFPVLGAKLEKAASEHPSFHYVDLSLMFTDEQVFADLAQGRIPVAGEETLGTDMVAARMAEEIVRSSIGRKEPAELARNPMSREPPMTGTNRPIWRPIQMYPALIAEGKFPNGFEHYRSVGFLEFRHSGFPRLG